MEQILESKEAYDIGIIGVTGLVGMGLTRYFEGVGGGLPAGVTRVFASERSIGEPVIMKNGKGHKTLKVEHASEADYSDLDIVCDIAPAGFAQEHGERIAGQATLITASSDLRKDPDVPLIIPEINPKVIGEARKNILAKSNCTTTIGSLAVYPLHQAAGLRSLTISTYQSVSGQGWSGVHEFHEHTRRMDTIEGHHQLLSAGPTRPYPVSEVFPEPTAFNVAAHAGDFEGDDTTEELKYKNETRKIFGFDEDVAIDVTCARVPVVNGHSVDIHAQFDNELTVDEARELLADAEGVQLHAGEDVPQPINAVGTTEVHVGRVRQSELFGKNGLRLWATGDNLTVGAAHNIFKTVKLLVSQSQHE